MGFVLSPEPFRRYVERFHRLEEVKPTPPSHGQAWDWMKENVPLFECPDKEVEEIYYFRWWTYRKHIRRTPLGFVVTEFLVPIKHAGIYNTISCAFGHHLAEGRWLRNQEFLDDYVLFWLRGDGGKPQPHFHRYSSWAQTAIYERCLVNGDWGFALEILDDLVADYHLWEQERQGKESLFWQFDVNDGMEESISGSRTERHRRPTINSYMFGNARAIAALARMAGREELAQEFEGRAASLKSLVQERLWDPEAQFFKVRKESGDLADVREAIGFIPWCFHLPDPGYEVAWAQLKDPEGFWAPYGITTAERRHPKFRSHPGGQCTWDGPVWPFATSQTLMALANVLRDYSQDFVTSRDYFDAFLTYVRCHRRRGEPYIGEFLDGDTGQWIKGAERSRFYNHSTFADLLITGLVGLRPRPDETVEVHPLLPEGAWEWFCLDGVRYHGHTLTILWDLKGNRYGYGQGLKVFADGRLIAQSPRLARVTGGLEGSASSPPPMTVREGTVPGRVRP